MRVVAIYAVVAGAFSAAEIPVAIHSTVATVFVVPVLWAMTLGAELYDVREWHR